MTTFASNYGDGFLKLSDRKDPNGFHYVRASSIIRIRPRWDNDETWTHCDVFTGDGRFFETSACVEQIMEALE